MQADPRLVVATALDPRDPHSPRAQRSSRRVLEALRRAYGVAVRIPPGADDTPWIVPLPAAGAERAGTGRPADECSWCGGQGRWDDIPCSACKGTGAAS